MQNEVHRQTMQVLPSLEEFQSLPPALRRKLFSNVERFRMRLALVDHGPVHSNTPDPLSSLGCQNQTLWPLADPSDSHHVFRRKRFRSSQRPCKRNSFQLTYLTSPADAQWFHSLPQKIQQTQFSKEEQLLLRQARCHSLIVDAADQTLWQVDQNSLQRLSWVGSSFASDTTIAPRPPSAFLDISDDSDTEMNDSFLDSFHWLDDDENLDLSLSDYRVHSPASPPPHHVQSRPSSRLHRNSPSRTSLAGHQPCHRVHSSTSSIDPDAQYYQDPEARLKLRVYLASPQKFDEAVEFGFPALENEKLDADQRPANSKPSTYVLTGTFFKDDDSSTFCSENDEKDQSAASQLSSILDSYHDRKSPSVTAFSSCRQSYMPSAKPGAQRYRGQREMTLRMTLTRPDLRTTDLSVLPQSTEDPLKLAALDPADTSSRIWEEEPEHSKVKKVWRKLRRQLGQSSR